MYQTLSRNGQTFGFLLGAVIVLLFVLIMGAGWSSFEAYGDTPERYNTSIFNFGMFAAMGLIILGVIAVVLFGIGQMASNPKAAMRGILGVVALIAVFLLSYATANGDATGPLAKSIENAGGISTNGLKLIGGGITTAIVLSLVAGVAILLSEVRNFFK
ncbi:MAG: hypothetical protein KF852_14865 [Saprospiraceae bacterium]|nr:hypothetical protein [Saprospiraceae bacterium]